MGNINWQFWEVAPPLTFHSQGLVKDAGEPESSEGKLCCQCWLPLITHDWLNELDEDEDETSNPNPNPNLLTLTLIPKP